MFYWLLTMVRWMLPIKLGSSKPNPGEGNLEKEMATHSSVLALRIPGTGKPGGLPSMGSHGVGHDWSDLAAAAANLVQLANSKHIYLNIIFRLSIYLNLYIYVYCCCCSVTELCLTLCDPMDCSMPDSLPLLSPGVCSNPCPSSQWCYRTISSSAAPSSLCLQYFLASGSFPVSQIFTSCGQSIGASASVLPMNSQGWFPLRLTGLISLQSKGLSRVFSSPTIQMHQFFGSQSCLWSSSHICTWLLVKL